MQAWIAAKHSIRAPHEQRLGRCRQHAAHTPTAVCCAPDLGAPGRQIQAREGWSPAAAHLHGQGQHSKVAGAMPLIKANKRRAAASLQIESGI